MIRVYHNFDHEGTAHEPRKEAPNSPYRQISAAIDTGFLTPAVFRQVRKAASCRKRPRWDLHPLLYVLLLSTWCCGGCFCGFVLRGVVLPDGIKWHWAASIDQPRRFTAAVDSTHPDRTRHKSIHLHAAD